MECRCDYCRDYARSLYRVGIDIAWSDLYGRPGEIHWVYGLCAPCYNDWLNGRISTRALRRGW